MSNLFLNVLFDVYPNVEAAGASLYPYLDRVPNATIHITTGARKEQGRQFALHLKQRYPAMDVILRILPDENPGNHQRYTPSAFVAAFAPWAEGGLVLSLNNEAGVGDLPAQNLWYSAVIEQFGKQGIRCATPSTQTHNPFPPEAFDSTYRMLSKYNGLFTLHYYWDSEHGILISPLLEPVTAYCKARGIALKTGITELGYAQDLAPQAGYHGRLDSAAYAEQLVNVGKRWSEVKFFVYGWGAQSPWQDFDISRDMTIQNALVNHNQERVPVTPPEILPPPNEGIGVPSTVIEVGIRLRPSPDLSAAPLRPLLKNEQVVVYDGGKVSIGGYPFHFLRDMDGKALGWASIADRGGSVWIKANNAPAFKMIKPVGCAVVVSSTFGVPRDYDGDGTKDDQHEGVDLAPAHKDCTPLILAGADGIVLDVSSIGDYGVHLKLKHAVGADTFVTWYCHMRRVFVIAGQSVKAGDAIGIMGSTGNSTGVHCHVNVQWIGHGLSGFVVPDVVDPLGYFAV